MAKLGKIQVTKGVYWLEVPEAQLYILCGCPADSVKHLKKRGLIVTREEHGVTFETGPNAILLSDVLLQNGCFSNMAEFPVLQMLYFQGMILPNHPNNTGIKPLLIGSEEQVSAQMEYIYRGNYGLVSKDEFIQAGVESEFANDLLRLKLKFAFGKIRKTEELLDSISVGANPIEIRNGVYIRRLRMNVFEFQYKGESVTIDLNLPPHVTYGVPYTQDFHLIQREYFGIIHSGEGDGWDVNRPTMASILMFQGKIYLIDAGPNILYSLTALGIGVNEIEGIFHTHAHDDHFSGLTTLMHADHKVKYFSTPLVRASVTKKLCALISIDEDDFSNYFEIHDLKLNEWNDIQSLEVMPILSPHPVETNIMIFRALGETGYRAYAHFADIVSLDVLKGMITDDPESIGINQTFYDQVKKNYLTEVNLKKLDIGGGMIHGKAEDFKEDKTDKIVLSHTSAELTHQQKEIGSGAPFGMVDVLIPTHQNYIRRYSFHYLQDYFPTVPTHQLRMLINHPIITFNPESILLKKGMMNDYIYLILTGDVEAIDSETYMYSIISSGGLIGEISGLTKTPCKKTYRASNFVQALRIPCTLYLEFVKRNNLLQDIEKLQERREFLRKTWLFGEAISYPIQNKLAQAMKLHQYPTGHLFSIQNNNDIHIIKSGIVQKFSNEIVFEKMDIGQFFGEEGVLFGMSGFYSIRILETAKVYCIPGEMLLDIPIVRWKLFETYEKKIKLSINPELSTSPIFQWRKEYSLDIEEIDRQHQELIMSTNQLFDAISTNVDMTIKIDIFNSLIQKSQNHFDYEEDLMKKHQFSELNTHRKKHERILQEIHDKMKLCEKNALVLDLNFVESVRDWLINHIFKEDRKIAQLVNKQT